MLAEITLIRMMTTDNVSNDRLTNSRWGYVAATLNRSANNGLQRQQNVTLNTVLSA